jgi:hypothetical protein
MAGYMTKLQGYVYEGELVNGATNPVANGTIMVQDGNTLVLPGAADTTTKFVCKEITDIYGELGYRFVVDKLNKRYYFVENGMDNFNDGGEYDNREYVTKKDDLLRAHPLLVGEEFIVSGAANAYVAGTSYGVLATGAIG